jgi:hypothetical protein
MMAKQICVYAHKIKMKNKIIAIMFGMILLVATVSALTSPNGVTYTFSEREKDGRIIDIFIGNHTQVIEGRGWFDNCKVNGTNITGYDCHENTFEEFVGDRIDQVNEGLIEQESLGIETWEEENYNTNKDILSGIQVKDGKLDFSSTPIEDEKDFLGWVFQMIKNLFEKNDEQDNEIKVIKEEVCKLNPTSKTCS